MSYQAADEMKDLAFASEGADGHVGWGEEVVAVGFWESLYLSDLRRGGRMLMITWEVD